MSPLTSDPATEQAGSLQRNRQLTLERFAAISAELASGAFCEATARARLTVGPGTGAEPLTRASLSAPEHRILCFQLARQGLGFLRSAVSKPSVNQL
jgi:hypothetical protein